MLPSPDLALPDPIEPPPEAARPTLRALIIEDDDLTNQLFCEALRDSGYEVAGAASAEEAVGLWQTADFSLVTLDVNLPGLSGLDFCRWLRLQDGGAEAFVLAITGRDEPEDLHAALQAGADDYLSKPVSLEHLLVRLAVADKQINDRLARRHAEAVSYHRELCFQALQDLASDGILTVDRREDRILTANGPAVALTGYTAEDLLRREIASLFPEWHDIMAGDHLAHATQLISRHGDLLKVELRTQNMDIDGVDATLAVFFPTVG